MALMGFAQEKRERDATVAEVQARGKIPGTGPVRYENTAASPESSTRPGVRAATAAPRETYQRAFDGESRDSAWADSAEQLAKDRLTTLAPPGSIVKAVECRSSMCRFLFGFPDRPSYERFVRSAFLSPTPGAWSAPSFTTLLNPYAEQDPLLAVSYLAREGRSLPALD
jgi:hypothetical protein